MPSPLFAEFEERRPPGRPRLEASIRRASPADAEAIAALDADRNGGDAMAILPRVLAELEGLASRDARRDCLVALDGERVVAYGRTRWMDYASDPAARGAPPGWYLAGVVVDPAFRRRGVAAALVRRRLEELRSLGAAVVRYFAAAVNRATLALHAPFGFVEVTRDFTIPGVAFTGGAGILLRAPLGPTEESDGCVPPIIGA